MWISSRWISHNVMSQHWVKEYTNWWFSLHKIPKLAKLSHPWGVGCGNDGMGHDEASVILLISWFGEWLFHYRVYFWYVHCSGLNLASQNIYIYQIIVSENVNLLGKRVLVDGIKLNILKWRGIWLSGWALNPMISVFIRCTKKADRGRGGYVKTEAEIGVMWP